MTLFLIPIIFVSVMTFGGVGNHQGIGVAKILIVNNDKGKLAEKIIGRLKKTKGLEIVDNIANEPISQSKADNLIMRADGYELAVVFPENFSENLVNPVNRNNPALVQFMADPAFGGMNLYPVERLIKIQIMHDVGVFATARECNGIADSTFVQTFPSVSSESLQNFSNRYLTALQDIDEKVQDNIECKRVAPNGLTIIRPIKPEEQSVPGYLIFGMFFIVQSIGLTLLREKENGTFNRLMAAPVSSSVILIGKLVPYYFVNLFQAVFMFAFGKLVFNISFGDHPLGLIVVALATAAATNGLGLLVASISKTAEQSGPLSGVIIMALATAGAIFIPYFEMPKIMQKIGLFTPHSWALRGFQDIIVRGYDVQAILPCAGVLVLFAIGFYCISLKLIRFKLTLIDDFNLNQYK